jgi:hypothetical protein
MFYDCPWNIYTIHGPSIHGSSNGYLCQTLGMGK